jgi:hypothetical protein
MTHETVPEVDQHHVRTRPISPMIGRRLLVRSDTSLADLHATIQIAFGWTDAHLHRFRIHGRDDGVSREGGLGFSQGAREVRLIDFQFRCNERFLYEYDFGDRWQHEVRIEHDLKAESKRAYPLCVGEQRAAPPEDFGGPWALLEHGDQPGMDRTGRAIANVFQTPTKSLSRWKAGTFSKSPVARGGPWTLPFGTWAIPGTFP